MYQAITVANWFINRANKEAVDGEVEGITALKLQKILYFAQSAHLGLEKGPLFDEEIVAWELGPVVAEVYSIFKSCGSTAIPEPAASDYAEIAEDDAKFLEEIWQLFGKYTAYRLVEITHDHLPWKEASRNEVITKESIASYYRGMFVEEGGNGSEED